MHTVLIPITRGFIVRNILRSGVLTKLKELGYKIVVVMPDRGDIPQYLKEEFEDDQVTLTSLKRSVPRGYSKLTQYTCRLVYSMTTWRYARIGNVVNKNRNFLWKYLELGFYYPLSKLHFLKQVVRWIEFNFFYSREYSNLFDKYKPDLVFASSIASTFDVFFIHEAKRRGIKTAGMPKGWDNIAKLLYRTTPDLMLVQNELMKKDLIRYQRYPGDIIKVVGFPQFDWYRSQNILQSRKDFMESFGFSESDRLVFFGSEGVWVPHDHEVAEALVGAANTGGLPENTKFLIRPHFTDAKNNRFDYLNEFDSVVVDQNFTHSNFFMDNWDPSMDEIRHLTNLVYHSDVLVTTASTLTLDAAAGGTPIVNLAYGGLYDSKTGQDITAMLYEADHARWVLSTGAVSLVHSEAELLSAIRCYFNDPNFKEDERQKLLKKLCFKVDGKSSERVVDCLVDLVNN